jgi:hypothetical protein
VFGFDVRVVFNPLGIFQGAITVLHNVTEIHYCYPHNDTLRMAFESDIHGTGVTYDLRDVREFEATLATAKASAF